MQDEQQPPSNEELRMITREPRSPAGETRDAFTTLQVVERKNREIQGNKCPQGSEDTEEIQDAKWAKVTASRALQEVEADGQEAVEVYPRCHVSCI
jgi:hypothetical protein